MVSRSSLHIAGLTFLLGLGAASPARSNTIRVPADEPTIQAGLDAAGAGDTVLVSCGVYSEHDIEMKSGVCLRSESGTPECVTIDAEGLGRVLRCTNASEGTVLEGLAFTGGSAFEPYQGGWGGGLLLVGSRGRVERCRFVENAAAIGGGLACADSDSTIVRDCHVSGNFASSTGGGMRVSHSAPVVENCRFEDNQVEQDGAGLCITYSSIQLLGAVIAGNTAGVWAGGLEVTGNTGSPVISGCTVVENTSAYAGSGIFSGDHCLFRLERTIIAFNHGSPGLYILDQPGYAGIECCDVYGNEVSQYGGELGDLTGTDGNISADPLFCDRPNGVYSLEAASPCAPDHSGGCDLIGALPVECASTGVVAGTPRSTGGLALRPNPVRSRAEFTIGPVGGTDVIRTIEILDAAGRVVDTVSGRGTLSWQPEERLGSGVYFARVRGGRGSVRITLVR